MLPTRIPIAGQDHETRRSSAIAEAEKEAGDQQTGRVERGSLAHFADAPEDTGQLVQSINYALGRYLLTW